MKRASFFKKKSKESFFQRKERVIRIIRQIKQFEKSIGFKPTKNFLRYESPGSNGFKKCFYNVFFTHKTVLPYSYDDSRIKEILSNKKPIDISKIDFQKYDIFSFESEAMANFQEGSSICDDLIKSPLHRIIYLVIHEDWHDNNRLPVHIDEPVGETIANIGALYFTYQYFPKCYWLHKQLREQIKLQLLRAPVLLANHQKLIKLYQKLRLKKISLKVALNQREKLFKKLSSECKFLDIHVFNNASLAVQVTYSRHLSLIYKLYFLLQGDLKTMVNIFKSIPGLKGSTQKTYQQIKSEEKQFIRYVQQVIEDIK